MNCPKRGEYAACYNISGCQRRAREAGIYGSARRQGVGIRCCVCQWIIFGPVMER